MPNEAARTPNQFADGKRERFLSHVEATSERRYRAFRPYHVRRNGKTRLGSYDMRHCSQAVHDAEKIEDAFHAIKMKARGFLRGYMGRWDGPYPAHVLAAHDAPKASVCPTCGTALDRALAARAGQ